MKSPIAFGPGNATKKREGLSISPLSLPIFCRSLSITRTLGQALPPDAQINPLKFFCAS